VCTQLCLSLRDTTDSAGFSSQEYWSELGEVGESGGSRKSIKLGVVREYLLSSGSI